MTIPDYQSVMLPLLKFASDGAVHSVRDAYDRLADEFGLSDEERTDLLPSGTQPTFENRVGWANTYMKKAGLLESSRRGYFQITSLGRQVLAENPEHIDRKFLMQYPSFVEFQRHGEDEAAAPEPEEQRTPEEIIEAAYQQVREQLAAELLETVKTCSPVFFERLVVDLLVRMGYGGTRRDAGRAIGRTGDDGIDGIIKEDRLGLDIVYVQAKRWGYTVGRPHIQQFAGALQGQRAPKGVFISTSTFSAEAHEYVSRLDSKIVLIDGEELARLMIDFGLGVTTIGSYELKRVDSDYFLEE